MGIFDFILGNKNDRKTTTFLALMLRIARADGEVSDDEFTHIRNFTSSLNLTENQKIKLNKKLRNIRTEEAIRNTQKFTEKEKIELFDEMISVAVSDGKISTDEMNLLAEVAREMGLSYEATREKLIIHEGIMEIASNEESDAAEELLEYLSSDEYKEKAYNGDFDERYVKADSAWAETDMSEAYDYAKSIYKKLESDEINGDEQFELIISDKFKKLPSAKCIAFQANYKTIHDLLGDQLIEWDKERIKFIGYYELHQYCAISSKILHVISKVLIEKIMSGQFKPRER